MSEQGENQGIMTMTAKLLDDVKASELPEIFKGAGVVRPSGINREVKITENDGFPVHSDTGRPLPGFLYPGDSFVPALVIGIESMLVGMVLRMSRLSEILFPTVKTIPVDMVDYSIGESHDKTMKANHRNLLPTLRDVCLRVKSIWFLLEKTPLEAAHHIRVLIVDKCKLSPRQWYRDHKSILANLTEMETNPPGIKMKVKEAHHVCPR